MEMEYDDLGSSRCWTTAEHAGQGCAGWTWDGDRKKTDSGWRSWRMAVLEDEAGTEGGE